MLKRMGDIDVKLGLRNVLARIQEICKERPTELQYFKPRLVAVSKTKPIEYIIQAYEEGQRYFGENYVQELVDKATDTELQEKCKDIKWHFIGHLQSNKVNKVLGIPNLHMIETVDSQKLANTLNQKWPQFGPPETKLNVMLQVNTSGEAGKNGASPEEIVNLVKSVKESCTNLNICGLMTIGQFGYDTKNGPNPDFLCLKKCRSEVCEKLSWDSRDVELSMGMSDDFEQAIELGSTNVRVGSSIFGYRPRKVKDN